MSKKHKESNAQISTSDDVIVTTEIENPETHSSINVTENHGEADGSTKTRRLFKSKRTKKAIKKHPMPVALRVLGSVLLLAGAATLFTWFILWRQNLCDFEATADFINEKPVLFAYSGLVVFAIMTVIAAVTWRTFFTIGFSFAFASVLTYIHMEKFRLRSAPLLPDDFLMADQARNVMEFVDIWSVVRLVVGVILIMAGSIMLEHYARKVIGRDRQGLPWWDRWALVPRVAFSMTALAALAMIVRPIINQEEEDWMEGIKLVIWNQTENYNENGFIIGFLYNLGRLKIEEPDGYSEETMLAIEKKYNALKKADTDRLPLDEVVENVVVILDETFYDPELLTKYYSHLGGDPLPNLRKIFAENPSGYMYSPEYGGGTANVEFEVQTGLTNFWSQSFPYLNAIPKTSGVLGVAAWAKTFGFNTTAVHSYDGTMYKRNLVYPLIGYDTFIDRDKMTYTERENESEYYNDRSVFNEILDILKNNNTPQMVGAVTMQNHSPYTGANYQELDYPLINIEHHDLVANFQSLHYADQYLGEFLAAIDELDEPTVVLWFGDHATGVISAYKESEEKSERDIAHLTPYFVYTNFAAKSKYTPAEIAEKNTELGLEIINTAKNVNLPTTTPNCLQNTMYNLLNVEKPAMFYLLDTVCEETPILSTNYFWEKTPTYTTALRDYQLTTYDVLAGQHYWDEY